MIWVVCINKDQPDSVIPMYNATKSFGDNRVLVLDRSPNVASMQWPNHVRNECGEGWLAGKMRDFGLSFVEKHDPCYTGVLFLDGDRTPQEDLLPLCVGDAVLFSTENDMRGEVPGRLVDCTPWCCNFTDSPFASPALYLSRKCIDRVKENGRLFAECFDGLWGEEDRDLGDRVVNAGFRVFASNAKVSGLLIDRYGNGSTNPRNFFLRQARRNNRLS